MHDVESLTSIKGENVPNLRRSTVERAPALKEYVLPDASSLEDAVFDDTDNLDYIEVPKDVEPTGDTDKAKISCFVVKRYTSTRLSEVVEATYDSEGKLLTMSREQDDTTDPYTNPCSTEFHYTDSGLLDRIDEFDKNARFVGSWDVQHSDDLLSTKYVFTSDVGSSRLDGQYREDIFSPEGLLLARSFRCVNDDGVPTGDMALEYNDDGQPVKMMGAYNRGQGILANYEVTLTYDAEGRLITWNEKNSDKQYV